MTLPIDHPQPSWGAKINTYHISSRGKDAVPDGCPPWASGLDVDHWQRGGLVIWEHGAQRLENLAAEEAVALLAELRASDGWRTDGVVISRRSIRYSFPVELQPTRGRKTKTSSAPEFTEVTAVSPQPQEETIVEERFRLQPADGVLFFEYLLRGEHLLVEMAEEDHKRQSEAMIAATRILFRSMHRQKMERFDVSARPLAWVRDTTALTMVCDLPPNRASVYLHSDGWSWEACIERPDRFKHQSPWLTTLEEAIAWAERELSLPLEPYHSEDDLPETVPEGSNVDLSIFQIEPAALEPERITYHVVIEIDSAPEHFKTMEMSFGRVYRYEKEYLTPNQLMRALSIDTAQFSSNRSLLHEFGHYHLFSVVTYYQAQLAAAQAQQCWDRSLIVKQHSAAKVTRARYGYLETETNFCTWLGACEDAADPWPKPPSRAEHMAELAMRQTLAHALDVEGYRQYLGLTSKLMRKEASDDRLLVSMHKVRSRSVAIPDRAREESRQWLKEHKHFDT